MDRFNTVINAQSVDATSCKNEVFDKCRPLLLAADSESDLNWVENRAFAVFPMRNALQYCRSKEMAQRLLSGHAGSYSCEADRFSILRGRYEHLQDDLGIDFACSFLETTVIRLAASCASSVCARGTTTQDSQILQALSTYNFKAIKTIITAVGKKIATLADRQQLQALQALIGTVQRGLTRCSSAKLAIERSLWLNTLADIFENNSGLDIMYSCLHSFPETTQDLILTLVASTVVACASNSVSHVRGLPMSTLGRLMHRYMKWETRGSARQKSDLLLELFTRSSSGDTVASALLADLLPTHVSRVVELLGSQWTLVLTFCHSQLALSLIASTAHRFGLGELPTTAMSQSWCRRQVISLFNILSNPLSIVTLQPSTGSHTRRQADVQLLVNPQRIQEGTTDVAASFCDLFSQETFEYGAHVFIALTQLDANSRDRNFPEHVAVDLLGPAGAVLPVMLESHAATCAALAHYELGVQILGSVEGCKLAYWAMHTSRLQAVIQTLLAVSLSITEVDFSSLVRMLSSFFDAAQQLRSSRYPSKRRAVVAAVDADGVDEDGFVVNFDVDGFEEEFELVDCFGTSLTIDSPRSPTVSSRSLSARDTDSSVDGHKVSVPTTMTTIRALLILVADFAVEAADASNFIPISTNPGLSDRQLQAARSALLECLMGSHMPMLITCVPDYITSMLDCMSYYHPRTAARPVTDFSNISVTSLCWSSSSRIATALVASVKSTARSEYRASSLQLVGAYCGALVDDNAEPEGRFSAKRIVQVSTYRVGCFNGA